MDKNTKRKRSFTYNGKRYFLRVTNDVDFEVQKALKIQSLEKEEIIESNMLFKAWAEAWLVTYKENTVTSKTYENYRRLLKKYIYPFIGNMMLKKVKSAHLQNVMNETSHLSQSTINKIYQTLSQIFEKALSNDLLIKNPAKHIEKPKGSSGSFRAITDHERKVILKVAEYHKHGLWIKILLFCGLRPGETARIQMNHIDFKKNLLYVDGTKTENAKRYVPLPAEIADEIKALKKAPFDYLFTNEYGLPIKPHNRGRMWKSFKKAMHIEMGGKTYKDGIIPPYMVAEDLKPYCLRHTFCTDLQRAGVPINVAKDLMGHSDISLTSKIYTHTTEDTILAAAEKMAQFRCGTTRGTASAKVVK